MDIEPDEVAQVTENPSGGHCTHSGTRSSVRSRTRSLSCNHIRSSTRHRPRCSARNTTCCRPRSWTCSSTRSCARNRTGSLTRHSTRRRPRCCSLCRARNCARYGPCCFTYNCTRYRSRCCSDGSSRYLTRYRSCSTPRSTFPAGRNQHRSGHLPVACTDTQGADLRPPLPCILPTAFYLLGSHLVTTTLWAVCGSRLASCDCARTK
jgi:hypothetical protein